MERRSLKYFKISAKSIGINLQASTSNMYVFALFHVSKINGTGFGSILLNCWIAQADKAYTAAENLINPYVKLSNACLWKGCKYDRHNLAIN